ncbi:MAG: ABC transporter permease [Gemmatimonadota bacterium]|nr:ABC transporter permease [Gemmatimonadota bacterium]
MAWYHRFANALRPRRLSQDLDRELSFHVAELVDDLVAGGMSERDALNEARRRFGNVGIQKERTRDIDTMAWLASPGADIRYALRALRRSPGFATVAVLSLALGIGANSAIFGLVDAVMLRSLPVQRPRELLQVSANGHYGVVSNPVWEQLRDRQDVFSSALAYGNAQFNLSAAGEARYAKGAWVSGDYFSTLGVHAHLGRLLVKSDDCRGCAPVAVLSYQFWRTHFAGDPTVVGRTIALNEHPFVIAGVSAAGFTGVEVGEAKDIFAPICTTAIVFGSTGNLDSPGTSWLYMLARPKPGIRIEQVGARLTALAPSIFEATVPANRGAESRKDYLRQTLGVTPAANGISNLRSEYGRALVMLMVVVALVLLIACANVANLLLTRATVREREIAIRLAIGAGRRRLIRQLLTESLLLSTLGAVAGAILARWGSRLLVAMLTSSRSAVFLDLSPNVRVFIFTAAVAVATGVLFGLVPAWRATHVQPHTAMKANGRGIARGQSRFSLGRALIVIQVAVSLVLVVGAGLMLGTFRRLTTLDTGFQREGVLLVDVDISGGKYKRPQRAEIFRNMLTHVRAVPGVQAAATSNITPVSGSAWSDDIVVDGYTAKTREDGVAFFNQVGDGYFETMGTRLLAGRAFDERDGVTAPGIAVVNESMARHFFATINVLGKRFRVLQGQKTGPPIEIVGIVEDAKYKSLRDPAPPTVYLALSQDSTPSPYLTYDVRAATSTAAIAPAVRNAMLAVSPAVSLNFTSFARQVDESVAREKLLATLSTFFGGLALLLATIGLYGVMSYNVARRRNEIGIRMALGAARARVMRMVLGEVALLVGIGVALGLVFALASSRLLTVFLYGMAPNDPATIAGAVLLSVLVAVVAGYLPARRASRVDPMLALREE